MPGSLSSCLLKDIDYYNVCRLCIKQGTNLLPLFHISDNLEYKLNKFCNIRVSIEDGLPPKVCVPCVEKVNKCYRFKVQCERSDAFLREYFNVEHLSDETDSNDAEDVQIIKDANFMTFANGNPSYKTEESEASSAEQDEGEEEDDSNHSDVQIISTNLSNRTGYCKETEQTKQCEMEQEGFHGWPEPDDEELAQQASYQRCLKKVCMELEDDVIQSCISWRLITLDSKQEEGCTRRVLRSSGTEDKVQDVTAQERKLRRSPRKKPEEIKGVPQRDYFTRRSWSTLQAKEAPVDDELLKPEHLLLNLGLRPQPDTTIEPEVMNQQMEGDECDGYENNAIENKITEAISITNETSTEEIKLVATEQSAENEEPMYIKPEYDGAYEMQMIETDYRNETEFTERKPFSVDEYSLNESIDIKDEIEDQNSDYDDTIMDYSNSESLKCNDDVSGINENSSDAITTLGKINEKGPQEEVWQWITKHYNDEVQSVENYPTEGRCLSLSTCSETDVRKELSTVVICDESSSEPKENAVDGKVFLPKINVDHFQNTNEQQHSEVFKQCLKVRNTENTTGKRYGTSVLKNSNLGNDTDQQATLHIVADKCKVVCVKLDHEDHKMAVVETEAINEKNENSKGYKCALCRKTFMVFSNWEIHQQKHENNMLYSCSQCNKIYEQEASLNKHIDWVHTAHNLTCPECAMVIITKCSLQRHMNRHKRVRSHKCSVCQRSFFSTSELHTHFETHLPKQCGICNKIFIHKLSLTAHMKCHVDVKHSCDTCGRMFSRRIYLERHKQCHVREFPYECDVCGISCSDKNTLLSHKNLHLSGNNVMEINNT